MSPPAILTCDPRSLFDIRAARLRALADGGSALSDYLHLMAAMAKAQHSAAIELIESGAYSGESLPGPSTLQGRKPDPSWRESLRGIVRRVPEQQATVTTVLADITRASDAHLDEGADRLLSLDIDRFDPATMPFVAAALQVHWSVAASGIDAERIEPTEPGHLCPVCGYLPVASLLLTGGAMQGLRYLVCALCASAWHRPRIHCVYCGSSKDVGHFAIEGAGEAIKAEACGECRTYVKLLNRDKDSQLDPFADDLASISLDLLMADEGYQRLGFNPMMVPGG